MMAALGLFVFELGTLPYEELQRRTDWRFGANPRVGARDAQQFVGFGEDTLALSGVAMAELMDGAASLDQLRDMAGSGEAYALIDAAGNVLGSYVVRGIDERRTDFFADGAPRRIAFGIDLLLVADPSA